MSRELRLLGLVGFKGSGKDEVAKILIRDFGYLRAALADPLKLETYEAFGRAVLYERHCIQRVTEGALFDPGEFSLHAWHGFIDAHKYDGPQSPYHWVRSAHQWWGTEYRRKQFGEDYWVNKAKPFMKPGTVFTDVRFPDERQAILDAGGIIVRVQRDSANCTDIHASEANIAHLEFDLSFGNNGTLEDLAATVHQGVYTLESLYGFRAVRT